MYQRYTMNTHLRRPTQYNAHYTSGEARQDHKGENGFKHPMNKFRISSLLLLLFFTFIRYNFAATSKNKCIYLIA